jgi:uncharacterized protein (TIGR02466 family)
MIEETHLFPTSVFNTHLKYFTPDYLKVIEKCVEYLNTKEKWKDNTVIQQTYNSDLHKENQCQILTDFFHKSLNEIKTRFKYDTESFEINLMWANKTGKNGYHSVHYHPNSYFSGVFYLSSGAPTYFKDPNIFKIASALNVKSDEDVEKSFLGNPGSLLIFPSWLYHGTSVNDSDERMTISFNSFPCGKTNYNSDQHLFSRMNIKSF